MGQKYSQLTLEERCRLCGLMEMKLSKTEIARRLGRHRSTIDRELARNSNLDGYRPDTADRRAWVRRLRGSRIDRSTRLGDHVRDRLAMGWSPEQIAGRMELDGEEHSVCAESIYRHIFSPAGRRDGLPKYLPQRKSRRGRRTRNGKREPSIPNRTPIAQRPDSVEDRTEFGHWEGDLVHFTRQRDILLTLHERSTRLTLMHRLQSKDASDTADAIIAAFRATRARRSPTIMAASSHGTSRSKTPSVCLPTFAIHIHRGNAVALRTPTDAFALNFHAKPISPPIPTRTSMTSSGS
jgi:IS30 family transposase